MYGTDPTQYGRATCEGPGGNQSLLEHFQRFEPPTKIADFAGHSHPVLFPTAVPGEFDSEGPHSNRLHLRSSYRSCVQNPVLSRYRVFVSSRPGLKEMENAGRRRRGLVPNVRATH